MVLKGIVLTRDATLSVALCVDLALIEANPEEKLVSKS
jgi:hypothetical protein